MEAKTWKENVTIMDLSNFVRDSKPQLWVLRAFIQKENIECQKPSEVKAAFNLMVKHQSLAIGWASVFTNALKCRCDFGATSEEREAVAVSVKRKMQDFIYKEDRQEAKHDLFKETKQKNSARSQASILWQFLGVCEVGDLVIVVHKYFKFAGLFRVTGPVEARAPSELEIEHINELKDAHRLGWKMPTRRAEFLRDVSVLLDNNKNDYVIRHVLCISATFFRITDRHTAENFRDALVKALAPGNNTSVGPTTHVPRAVRTASIPRKQPRSATELDENTVDDAPVLRPSQKAKPTPPVPKPRRQSIRGATRNFGNDSGRKPSASDAEDRGLIATAGSAGREALEKANTGRVAGDESSVTTLRSTLPPGDRRSAFARRAEPKSHDPPAEAVVPLELQLNSDDDVSFDLNEGGYDDTPGAPETTSLGPLLLLQSAEQGLMDRPATSVVVEQPTSMPEVKREVVEVFDSDLEDAADVMFDSTMSPSGVKRWLEKNKFEASPFENFGARALLKLSKPDLRVIFEGVFGNTAGKGAAEAFRLYGLLHP